MNSFTLSSIIIPIPFPLSPPLTHQKTTISISNRTPHFLKPVFPCFTHFKHRQNPISKVVRSSMGKDKVLDSKDATLLVNTCITYTLPPALTLEQGLYKIKEAVEDLIVKPHSCSSGMYRFQIAVPPSAKALKWFCSQPESSEVFPLFFLSNEKDNPTYKSLSLGRTRGVFGIGSALNFKGHSTHASEKYDALQRYLPTESTSLKAYGFLNTEFDTKKTTIKDEIGSFDFFIPQIELDEFEDISFLIATLAWDDSSMCTFNEAVRLFELSFDQARHSCVNGSKGLHSSLSNFKNIEEQRQMIRVNALSLDGRHLEANNMELSVLGQTFTPFIYRK